MGNNVQTRVASVQTSLLFQIIPEGDMDAQITGCTYKNNAHITQQSFAIQLREIQATKHQQYMQYKSKLSVEESINTIEKEHQPAHDSMQPHNNKKNTQAQILQRESSRKHNNGTTQFSRKLQPRRKIATATFSIEKAAITPRRTEAISRALLTTRENINSTMRSKRVSGCWVIPT